MTGFKKAERKFKYFKGNLQGISGSGKTLSALKIMKGLVDGGKIAVIDAEQDSASLYSDEVEFDTYNLTDTSIQGYIAAIKEAVTLGYRGLIIDGLSPAWDWALEEVGRVQARTKTSNSFTPWKEVTPVFNRLIKAIVSAPIHIIATMRSKSEYILEDYQDSRGNTRQKPKKVGMAPIFRQGHEYEFDLVAEMDSDNRLLVEKTRYKKFNKLVVKEPGEELGKEIRDWLLSGKVEESLAAPVVEAEPAKNPGEHVIETDCSMKGKTVAEVFAQTPGWVDETLISKPKRDKLTKSDLHALVAYKQKTEPQEE